MKKLYIVYDWRYREVLVSSYDKVKVYAYIGELAEKGDYDEDMHFVEIDLEGVREWGCSWG